jgi:hypothetical protein
MTKGTATGKKSKGAKRIKALTADVKVLERAAEEGREQFIKAKRTQGEYKRYIKRGKEVLADIVEARRKDGQDDGVDTQKLSQAFERPPNEYSAIGLEWFIVQKCFTENLGISTANGIHGAFCHYWDTMYVNSLFGRELGHIHQLTNH